MRFLLSVSKGIDDATALIGLVARWLTLAMVLIGVLNVVTRYVGRSVGIALGGTEYIVLQTYAFNLVFLLGAAYVLRIDGHVRVDIIYGSLSRRARAWIDVAGTLVFLVPFAVMSLLLSGRYVATSWRQQEVNLNAGGMPIYPIKTVIVIAFALLLAQAISETIKNGAFLAGHPRSRSMHDVPREATADHQPLFDDPPTPSDGVR